MSKTYRIELHDPKRDDGTPRYTPPVGQVRVVYDGGPAYEDVPKEQVLVLIEDLLRRDRFDDARNFANAWFVALANSYGYHHVELGPKPSSGT